MRRKDKEIKDRNIIETILNKELCCRLGLVKDNIPYVVPMNFAYKDNCIYMHSILEGTKMDVLAKNNNVCIEVDSNVEIIKEESICNWGTKYLSVIAFGKAEVIVDREAKIEGLNIIMEKYSGVNNHEYNEKALDRIAVIKITLDSITGKKSGF